MSAPQPTGPDADGHHDYPSVAAAGRNNGELSRSMILQTALAIVDRDGVDRLSMRRLSVALGRDPVMLYRHVANKAAVLDGVAELDRFLDLLLPGLTATLTHPES